MATKAAIWFLFPRKIVTTTPPEPQAVETWGFYHKVQFRRKAPRLNLKSDDCQNDGYDVIRKPRFPPTF